MNKIVIAIFIFSVLTIIFIIPEGNADSYQNSSMTVSVDVLEPIAEVAISPNFIDFGKITKGYETNYTNISFTNRGDLDINIIPVLEHGIDDVFNYTEFATASCSTWHNLSYYGNHNLLTINKPENYNGERTNFACMKIDLSNYAKEISSDRLDLNAQITFWIMPA
jgi:hypothetical protein